MTTLNEHLACVKRSTVKGHGKIPTDIVDNADLKEAIEYALPQNYDFEIEKTLWRIRQDRAKHVGLQFPEGLLIFAPQIAEILKHFSSHPIDITILGDVTYGACCIDDLTAQSIGVDLLVHYGHSCLVPLDQTSVKCLYIFVDIVIDYRPLVEIIQNNFPPKYTSDPLPSSSNDVLNVSYSGNPTIAILGTIQYSSTLHAARETLVTIYGDSNVIIPQELPLTAGEVLGCTSPNFQKDLEKVPDFVIFIADGRFHLESALIHNPNIPFFRYDPYLKTLTREYYDINKLHSNRQGAIAKASKAKTVGIILGTLGRQGSVGIYERIQALLKKRGIQITLFLMSEIMPHRLQAISKSIDAFVQVACPRLSIDWGHCFNDIPLLTPYEAFVAYGDVEYQSVYPMDFYSNKGNLWTNFGGDHRNGSLVSKFDNSLSDIERRKALIRQRLENRRRERGDAIS